VRTGRLGLALGVAISLLLAAGVLWLVGFVGASAADCPSGTNSNRLSGLEAPRSLWPPGAECAGAGQDEPTVAELVPGLSWAIVALAFAGLAILASGIGLEIRALRSRAARADSSADSPSSAIGVHPIIWSE
jgi:hypothetical protein